MPRRKLRSLDIGIYKGITILILINTFVFFQVFEWRQFLDDPLKVHLNEDVREKYGFTPYSILHFEKLHTIFTHMFFHDGLLHFAGNMAALFLLGCMIEKRLGTKRFIALYFLSGLVAVALSCVLYPNYGENNDGTIQSQAENYDQSIIGATAAVYGIVAAACIWRPKAKIIWPLTSLIAMLIMFPFALAFKHAIPHIADLMGKILSEYVVNLIILIITIIFVVFVLYILHKSVKVKTWVFAVIFIVYSIASVEMYIGDLPVISLVGHFAGFITGFIAYPIIAKREKGTRKITTYVAYSRKKTEKKRWKIKEKIISDLKKDNTEKALNYMSDKSSSKRKNAYVALASIYNEQDDLKDQILDFLRTLFEDKNKKVRQTALYALGEIGKTDAERVVEMFEEAMSDQDHLVRISVYGALKEMGQKNPEPAIEFAKKFQYHSDPKIRRRIIQGIKHIGKMRPQDILPILRDSQNDEDEKVRDMVINVIGEISYKNGCLEIVIADIKTWENKEIVESAIKEIIAAHKKHKKISEKSTKEAKKYIKENL